MIANISHNHPVANLLDSRGIDDGFDHKGVVVKPVLVGIHVMQFHGDRENIVDCLTELRARAHGITIDVSLQHGRSEFSVGVPSVEINIARVGSGHQVRPTIAIEVNELWHETDATGDRHLRVLATSLQIVEVAVAWRLVGPGVSIHAEFSRRPGMAG